MSVKVKKALKGTASAFGMKIPKPQKAEKRNNTNPALNPRPITAAPIEPEGKVTLHDLLESAYYGHKEQRTAIDNLSKAGYVRDEKLSNHNQSVFYNPQTQHAHVVIAGTHNFNDAAVDAQLLLTKDISRTKRYKDAKNIYKQTQDKYHPTNTTVSGHSLGGYIAQNIAGKNDKVYTYNKASLGQRDHPHEKAFRESGDIVSFLGALNKTTYTNNSYFQNPIEAHSTNNLKHRPIFID